MALVELPEDIETLLDDVVRRDGKDKLFHLREAVLEYVSEKEAIRIAEERYADLLAGRNHTVPLEEIMREYGMEFELDATIRKDLDRREVYR